METENLPLNNSGHGDIIEQICEHLPDLLAPEFLKALLVEAIDLGNSSGFVVASGEVDTFGVPDFECHKQGDGLNGVVASIDEISHEEVVGEGHISADREEFDKIMQLPMDIPADGNRGLDRYGVAFFREDSGCFFGYQFDLFLGDGFKRFKVVDNCINLCPFAHFK